MSPRGRGAPTTGIELVWPGKYDEDGRRIEVPPRPRLWHERERHGDDGPADELVRGDNLDVLDGWLERFAGRVDLVVIDPPFSTGTRFDVVTRVGEDDDALAHAPAYADHWPGGTAEFLAMLAPRLQRIHALLAPHGSLYVHVDPTVGHAVKLLLDEVFGPASFQREIVWRIGWVSGFKTRAKNWIRNHDTLFFYAKDPAKMRFTKVYVPHPPGYQRRAGAPAKAPGIAVDDVWNAGPADLALAGRESLDSIQIKSFSQEKTGYATQKNESLLRRILAASSQPGDWVADPFCGSGTTLAVAAAMGRRFLGCDCGRAAFQIARTRLLAAPRTRPLVIAEVEPTGRDDGRALAIRRWGARAVADGGPIHGTCERAAVHVAESIDRDGLAALVEQARAAGHAGLHVLARRVALALEPTSARDVCTIAAPRRWNGSPRFDVVLAVLDRDALGEPDIDAIHAVPERPHVELRVHGLARRAPVVELVELSAPHPERWPADLRAHARGGTRLVESMAIAWDARGGEPVRFTEVRARTSASRKLALRFEPPPSLPTGPFSVIVQIVDVRHVATRVAIELAPGKNGLRVVAATLS